MDDPIPNRPPPWEVIATLQEDLPGWTAKYDSMTLDYLAVFGWVEVRGHTAEQVTRRARRLLASGALDEAVEVTEEVARPRGTGSRVQIPPAPPTPHRAPRPTPVPPRHDKMCDQCGGFKLEPRDGSCLVCADCGFRPGCGQ